MNKLRLNAKDLSAGGILIAVAIFGLVANYYGHDFGTARRMGPGYMPALVCGLLLFLGILVTSIGLNNGPDALERWAFKELILILVAFALFGFMIEKIGFALSIALTVVIAALADKTQTIIGTIGCILFLIALCWFVFIWGLDLRLPMFPPSLVQY